MQRFYASLIELFNDGWFYAVKLEIFCPEDQLRRHANYRVNGQLVAPPRAIIIDAVHVQVIHQEQIPPSRHMYYYWDPYHEANPTQGPWVSGYRPPAVPDRIVDFVRETLDVEQGVRAACRCLCQRLQDARQPVTGDGPRLPDQGMYR